MAPMLRFVLCATVASDIAAAQEVIWAVGGKRYQLNPSLALLGDVNGDGTPDLAAATDRSMKPRDLQFVRALDGRTGATIWEVLNSANQNYFADSLHPLNDDVDGDGVVDLMVLTSIPAELRIHSGADGHELVRKATPDRTTWADVVGDCDGDGVDDLAVCVPGNWPLTVELWSATTLAKFRTLVAPLPPTTRTWSADLRAAGDFDGDGSPDLAVGVNNATFAAAVLFSLADGHLIGQATGNPADDFANGLEVLDDFDGDGHPDLAVRAGSIPLLWPVGDVCAEVTFYSGATFAPMRTLRSADEVHTADFDLGPVLGDIDGDGVRDFLLGEREGPFESDGTLPLFVRSGATLEPLLEASMFARWRDPIVGGGDFDGDGFGDLAVIQVVYGGGTVDARRGAPGFFSLWPRTIGLLLGVRGGGPTPPDKDDPRDRTAHWLGSGFAPGTAVTLWLVSEDGVAVNAPLAVETADAHGTALADFPIVPIGPRVYEVQLLGLDLLGHARITEIRRLTYVYE